MEDKISLGSSKQLGRTGEADGLPAKSSLVGLVGDDQNSRRAAASTRRSQLRLACNATTAVFNYAQGAGVAVDENGVTCDAGEVAR